MSYLFEAGSDGAALRESLGRVAYSMTCGLDGDPSFCSVPSCGKGFIFVSDLLSHVYSHHKEFFYQRSISPSLNP